MPGAKKQKVIEMPPMIVKGKVRKPAAKVVTVGSLNWKTIAGDSGLTGVLGAHVCMRTGNRDELWKGNNNRRGRVFGPQVEIEGSGANGAEAGYVYGEATGRGWLMSGGFSAIASS